MVLTNNYIQLNFLFAYYLMKTNKQYLISDTRYSRKHHGDTTEFIVYPDKY